ncbi:MAG: hypothetical protein MJ250_00625 [Alphaproteobacteria bacterium]|nr:hypothetical protein [Alphaproteobacteria bacterium]
MLKSILISILFILQFSFSVKAEIIPLTYGDLEQYMQLTRAQKTKYIYDFYKKNKNLGASDGEILNEILKINEVNSDPIVEYLSNISKKVQDFETYAQYAIAEINKQIENTHPNQPEKFVDIDDRDTWKNVKYVVPKINPTEKYFESIIQKKCFSKPTYINGAALLLASCAVKNREQTKILSGIMVLLDDGYSVLFKKNNELHNLIHLDFNNSSENFHVNKFYYPIPLQNSSGDLIFKKEMILPFELDILDQNQQVNLNINLSLPICFNNKCQNITFPTTSLQIEQSPVYSESCIQLEQAKYLSLNNSGKKINLNEIFIYPNRKTIELSISKKILSNKSNIFLFGSNIITGTPIILSDGNNYVYKFPILNSDQISKGISDIDVYIHQERSTHLLHQKLQIKEVRNHFYSFSLKNISFFLIYFFVLFLCTPFSMGAFSFLHKIIHNEHSEEAEEFFNVYIKSFSYSFLFIVATLFTLHYSKIFWGMQFNYIFLNYLYLVFFIFILINLKKKSVEWSSQKQGFVVGIFTVILPLISPLLSIQYNLYSLIKQSPIFYIVTIYIIHFIIMSSLFYLSMRIKFMDKYHSKIKKLIYIPLFISCTLLTCIIFIQCTVLQFTLCAFCVFILFTLLNKIGIKYFIILICLNTFFLPMQYSDPQITTDIDNFIRNETSLGNTVLISVNENGCLYCKIEKSIISRILSRKKISKIKSISLPYNHEWIRNQVENTTSDVLPLGFIYTGRNNQILPNFIFPWSFEYLLTHQF